MLPIRGLVGALVFSFLLPNLGKAELPPGRWQGVHLGAGRVSALAVDPRDSRWVYAATFEGRLLRSTDGGERWTDSGISAAPGSGIGLLQITVHPSLPDVVFAFGGGGFFRTTDRGASWRRIESDVLPGGVISLSITRTVPAVAYATAQNGTALYRSLDAGGTWQLVSTTTFSTSIAVDPTSPDVLFRSYILPVNPGSLNNPGYLDKSSDGGHSWRRLRSDWATFYRWIVVDPQSPLRVFISAGGWIERSDDGGTTWHRTEMPGTDFYLSDRGVLYSALLHGGVLRSQDGGDTWTSVGCGLEPYRVNGLAVSAPEERIYAGTLRGDVFRYESPSSGVPSCSSLFLRNLRYVARVDWRAPDGREGSATAIPLTSETGAFWFFAPGNLELVLKILDGTSINGHRWVFYAGLTNVEFTLTIVDHIAHFSRAYFNPQGQMSSVADTTAVFQDPLPTLPGSAR